MKVDNINRDILRIIWTTWEISMTFSGKMWLDNIKSHKKTEFHPLFRRYIFWKTTEGEGGSQTDLSPAVLWLKIQCTLILLLIRFTLIGNQRTIRTLKTSVKRLYDIWSRDKCLENKLRKKKVIHAQNQYSFW